MPLTWFPLAIIACLAYGVQNFLYKDTARRGYGSAEVTLVFSVAAGVMSGLLVPFVSKGGFGWGWLIVIAIASALTFCVTIMARLEALQRLDGTIVFPIVRMQSALLVVFGVMWFGEEPNRTQTLGVVFAIAVILLSIERPLAEAARHREGLFYSVFAMLTSAVNVLVCRSAAKTTDITMFFALSFLLTAVLTMAVRPELPPLRMLFRGWLLLSGSAIALCNVIGAYALLYALQSGPLFAVSAIYNQSFVVSVVLVMAVHRERLTLRRGVLLAAAAFSMALLEG